MLAGEWPKDVADRLFTLANSCLMEKKRDRPFISDVIEQLSVCVNSTKTNTSNCETALLEQI